MAITEVFPNPTVKQVIYQIRFPNLFYLENKMGEFQLKIMEVFPESSQTFKHNLLVSRSGSDLKLSEKEADSKSPIKIWEFKSKTGVILSVQSDSLTISSTAHKTYNNEAAELRFRDTIRFVIDSFFEVISIPIIKRLGLRYIDECPIPNKTTEAFANYYNTTLDIKRFKIEDAVAMEFKTTVKYSDLFLNYREAYVKKDEEYVLILDFDGYKNDIKTSEYLGISDRIHDIISNEFEKTIKEPVYEFMRQSLK